MLILTRKIGEVLRIGDDIQVTVLALHGQHVRIGIKAPLNVAVDREEVAERKRLELAAREPSQTKVGKTPTIRVRKSRKDRGLVFTRVPQKSPP